MPPARRSATSRAIRSRDRGLHTVSVVTRGLVATSVGVAGLFSAMAAWAQPGHAKTAQTSSAAGAPGGTFSPPPVQPAATPTTITPPTVAPPTDPSSGDGGNATAPLSPPTTLPAPVYQYTPPAPVYQYNPPPVVSGAS
jgi:hypothetical protein